MFKYEVELWDSGYRYIAGIDEVGRGPMAGPVVASAVVIPKQHRNFPNVNDSKKLTEKKREELFDAIIGFPNIAYSIALVDVETIDQINILRATHLAMKRALELLKCKIEIALIDGKPIKEFPTKNIPIVKGDAKSASIASASILAKVYRDRIMKKYAKKYPEYGFEKHKGYCTKQHIDAVKKYGILPIHRKSFSPIKELYYLGKTIQLEMDI